MSFGDFLFELLKEERDKAIIETLEKAAQNPNEPIKIEEPILPLTDEEFHEFMERNKHFLEEK